MAPPLSLEAREITVGRDQFACMLDCQCSQIGIKDQLPATRESLDIVVFEQGRCLVDIVTQETTASVERDQFEAIRPFRRRRRPQEHPDRLLDEAADRAARLGGTLLQLREEPVV